MPSLPRLPLVAVLAAALLLGGCSSPAPDATAGNCPPGLAEGFLDAQQAAAEEQGYESSGSELNITETSVPELDSVLTGACIIDFAVTSDGTELQAQIAIVDGAGDDEFEAGRALLTTAGFAENENSPGQFQAPDGRLVTLFVVASGEELASLVDSDIFDGTFADGALVVLQG